MRYRVNESCIGCGLCEGICPEVFSMDSSGVAVAINSPVAPEHQEAAESAMNSCPAGAIEEA